MSFYNDYIFSIKTSFVLIKIDILFIFYRKPFIFENRFSVKTFYKYTKITKSILG